MTQTVASFQCHNQAFPVYNISDFGLRKAKDYFYEA